MPLLFLLMLGERTQHYKSLLALWSPSCSHYNNNSKRSRRRVVVC
jgi:hypothetical protein